MRTSILVLALLVAGAATARAQFLGLETPEVRPFAGAYVPTGPQRDVLKDAFVVGGQVAIEARQNFHVLGTFGWSPSEARFLARDNGVNLYQADIGGEYFRSYDLNDAWMLRPFGGLGLGVRTFDYRDIDAHAKSYLTGYGALGSELQSGSIALRLEVRDYVYRMRGLAGNEGWQDRNDLAFLAGMAWHIR